MPVDGTHGLDLEVESLEHNGQSSSNFSHCQRCPDAHSRASTERQILIRGGRDCRPAFRHEAVGIDVNVRAVMSDELAEDYGSARIHANGAKRSRLDCDSL